MKPLENQYKKGGVGEARFISEAIKNGFSISVPFLGSSSYDCLLDNGKKIFKIQVKTIFSQKYKNKSGYMLSLHFGSKRNKKYRKYSKLEADVIVGYIEPLDIFYLFPIEEMDKFFGVSLFPNSKRSKYNKFINNWSIFI